MWKKEGRDKVVLGRRSRTTDNDKKKVENGPVNGVS